VSFGAFERFLSHQCALESMSYDPVSNCHGRGRGFEWALWKADRLGCRVDAEVVNLRRVNRAMSQNLLNEQDVHTGIQQPGRKSSPEIVWAKLPNPGGMCPRRATMQLSFGRGSHLARSLERSRYEVVKDLALLGRRVEAQAGWDELDTLW
jgi:hypothetical protein